MLVRLATVATRRALAAPWTRSSRIASRPAVPRFLSSGAGSAAPAPAASAAVHVTLSGIGAFIVADQGMSATLKTVGIVFPSSVACIIVGGAASLHPRLGPALQRALGPGAAWLRGWLPVFLAPPVLSPFVMDNPGAEYVGKMAFVALAGLLTTLA